jgi:hypothetical protein
MTPRQVCELLVAAYERGTGSGESVDWSDLDTAYEAAVRTLAETALRQSRLEGVLAALLDWGLANTSPRDANSPHELLVAACEALEGVTPRVDDERAARAWRYATRTMTQEDADRIRYECQQAGGFYPLAAFTRETVLELCRDRWGDFPMLQSLVENACQRVSDKWSSHGHDADAAEEWAIGLVAEYAAQQGFELVEREDEA